MDLYETSNVSDRDSRTVVRRLAARYEAVVKFFGAMVLAVGTGFAIRMIFENQLGQVFGAMLVWFSIIFALFGLLFLSLFWLRGRIVEYRRGQ